MKPNDEISQGKISSPKEIDSLIKVLAKIGIKQLKQLVSKNSAEVEIDLTKEA